MMIVFVKLIGAFFVAVSCYLYGAGKGNEYRKRLSQMEELQRIFCGVQSEIRYERAYLSEIFRYESSRAGEPYKTWLKNLSYQMEQKGRGSFAKLWCDTIDEDLSGQNFPEEEKEQLKLLGDQLGSIDADQQVRVIELYLERLNGKIGTMRREIKEKIRLCYCMGIMGGMLVVILLI